MKKLILFACLFLVGCDTPESEKEDFIKRLPVKYEKYVDIKELGNGWYIHSVDIDGKPTKLLCKRNVTTHGFTVITFTKID